MRHTNKKNAFLTAIAAVAAVLQSGCISSGPAMTARPNPYNTSQAAAPQAGYEEAPYNVAPAAGPRANPYNYQAEAMAQNAYYQQRAEASSQDMKERLERLEKAMLRLDRRMQLVERNELHRMSGTSGDQISSLPATPQEEQTAMRSLNIGPSQREDAIATRMVNDYQGATFRAVSEEAPVIRSALQAAPQRQLASLADVGTAAPAAGRSTQAASDVAVWTVRYNADNVWPDREQLPLSRQVVEALRASPNATLFARGSNPNAAQFRERVKALSRYLAKVTSLESVPIAALPSPQLQADTIEILATH